MRLALGLCQVATESAQAATGLVERDREELPEEEQVRTAVAAVHRVEAGLYLGSGSQYSSLVVVDYVLVHPRVSRMLARLRLARTFYLNVPRSVSEIDAFLRPHNDARHSSPPFRHFF